MSHRQKNFCQVIDLFFQLSSLITGARYRQNRSRLRASVNGSSQSDRIAGQDAVLLTDNPNPESAAAGSANGEDEEVPGPKDID